MKRNPFPESREQPTLRADAITKGGGESITLERRAARGEETRRPLPRVSRFFKGDKFMKRWDSYD